MVSFEPFFSIHEAARPASCAVENGKDGDRIALETIGDDERGPQNDQFAGPGNAPWPSHFREVYELFYGVDDRFALPLCGTPVVLCHIFMGGLKLRLGVY